ncbi:MAG: DUF4159 domain-containing protein [Vicinamibacterales bacterium]
MSPARRLAVSAGLVLTLSATAWGQWDWGRLPEGPSVPARYPDATMGDGAFSVCKLMYTSVRREAQGMGWATDYPYAGHNLMIRLSELTKTPISRDQESEPNYWVVSATDPALFRCPFVMAADAGTMGLNPEEIAGLRAYLLKGGFLWSDDFWGTAAWEQFAAQMKLVLPEYRVRDVPPDHPIRRTLYTLDELPQITNINLWRRHDGETRERGWDSPHANFRMIADDENRIMVLMTHNTDVADSWERETEDREFFLRFAPGGYAVGVNVALYAMTH